MTALRALEHHELPHGQSSTGEDLLDRGLPPSRIWVPEKTCLVVGHSQDLGKELRVDNVEADGVTVYRRRSGGGAVLLSPSCLCVALRFRKTPSLGNHDCFAMGSGIIARAVKKTLGLDLEQRGISDLACRDKKVVGCSLYMPRDFALYLASILIEADYSGMDRYLAHPSKEPEYRARRGHRDFLAGLAELAGKKIRAGDLIPALQVEIDSLSEALDGAAAG
jgi:lipoate-protein ligase A